MENKSVNGNSDQDNPHSVAEPIAAPKCRDPIASKARIKWPRGNQSSVWSRLDQELSATLTKRLKGSTAEQLSSFCDLIHNTCLEKFGEDERKKSENIIQQPNQRQLKKGQLRARQRQLKRQLQGAPDMERTGIQTLLDDIRQQILVISRAENQRKRRKRKRKARESFYKNPFGFAKKLFTATKNGQLNIPQEELEAHLHKFHSSRWKVSPSSRNLKSLSKQVDIN